MSTKKDENENIKMKNEFKEIINKELAIVNIYNSLYKACYKEYYREFKIQEDEKFIIFQLLKEKIKFLELTEKEKMNDYEKILMINLFKALFVEKKYFNLDYLEKKNNIFLFAN